MVLNWKSSPITFDPSAISARVLVERARTEGGLKIELTWRPFELIRTCLPEGVDIAHALGFPESALEQMERQFQLRAQELGLPVGGKRRLVNTHDALLLTEWTAKPLPHPAPADCSRLSRLFRRGRQFDGGGRFADICLKAELPADEALAQMRDPEYEKRLAASMDRARAFGITATPTFLFENGERITGALPYEVFVQALREFASRS